LSLNEHEEWIPYVEHIKGMYGVINKENLVEEDPQSPLEDDEAMEDLVAPPLEEHNDEDSSNIFIEDQAHEESIVEEAHCFPWKTLMNIVMLSPTFRDN
jgi:hypothetical protein